MRNLEVKKKLISLKQSPIYSLQPNAISEDSNKRISLRRKGLEELSKVKINDPYSVKQTDNSVVVDNLLIESNKL